MRNFRDIDATADVGSIFCLAYASDEYVERFLDMPPPTFVL